MSTLRELHEAATPGPWRVGSIEPTAIVVGDGWTGRVLARLDPTNDGSVGFTADDRALIAAARNALPLLLDVVDAARAIKPFLRYMAGSDLRPVPEAVELEEALAALDAAQEAAP